MRIVASHPLLQTVCQHADGLSTRSGNMSKPSTHRGDTPRNPDFLDAFPKRVPVGDGFATERHAQFADLSACNAQAKSAKLEQAIKANLRGLGYGG